MRRIVSRTGGHDYKIPALDNYNYLRLFLKYQLISIDVTWYLSRVIAQILKDCGDIQVNLGLILIEIPKTKKTEIWPILKMETRKWQWFLTSIIFMLPIYWSCSNQNRFNVICLRYFHDLYALIWPNLTTFIHGSPKWQCYQTWS